MPSQLVTARGQPSLHTVPYMPYPTTAAILPQNLQLPKNNVQFAMHPTAIQLQPPLCITSIVLTPVNGLQGIDSLAFQMCSQPIFYVGLRLYLVLYALA